MSGHVNGWEYELALGAEDIAAAALAADEFEADELKRLAGWLSGAPAPAPDGATAAEAAPADAAVAATPAALGVRVTDALLAPVWSLVAAYAYEPSYAARVQRVACDWHGAVPTFADSGAPNRVDEVDVRVMGPAVASPAPLSATTTTLALWCAQFARMRLGYYDASAPATARAGADVATARLSALFGAYGGWQPTAAAVVRDAMTRALTAADAAPSAGPQASAIAADATASALAAAAAAAPSESASASAGASDAHVTLSVSEESGECERTTLRVYPPRDVDVGAARMLCDAFSGASYAWPVLQFRLIVNPET